MITQSNTRYNHIKKPFQTVKYILTVKKEECLNCKIGRKEDNFQFKGYHGIYNSHACPLFHPPPLFSNLRHSTKTRQYLFDISKSYFTLI